jgi:ribosomal-protein-alanine N-acetyltransferase
VTEAVGIVETEHLLLRPWESRDAAELERLFTDPAVRGGRNVPPERILRMAEDSARQWRVNGFGPWAAIEKTSRSWIGRVGLDELADWPGPDKVEVGFELHQAWWGRGLATEAARAALRFGFERHALPRVISVTAASHAAARRVIEKAGLTYQSTRYWMSTEVPVVCYVIDRATWEARREDSWRSRT